MSQETCYLCTEPIPEGQSFYQDHGVQVCLSCFKDHPRCSKCKFPSKQLQLTPGLGNLCEFCLQKHNDSGMNCFLCDKVIPLGISYYEGHDKTVCQPCFQDATRCFLCKFPQSVKDVPGLGPICSFCDESALQSHDPLDSFLGPLEKFLKPFLFHPAQPPQLSWLDWNLIVGMQMDLGSGLKAKFLDDVLPKAYPIFFLRGKTYCIPRISQDAFMCYMAGQLVAADLCLHFEQPHLLQDSPFFELARGWSHWVSFVTASTLKYDDVRRALKFWPEPPLCGSFAKFQAMMEYRSLKEIIQSTKASLIEQGHRYL